jgi:hypothetical protein
MYGNPLLKMPCMHRIYLYMYGFGQPQTCTPSFTHIHTRTHTHELTLSKSLSRWRRQQLHSSWPHQQQGRHREHTFLHTRIHTNACTHTFAHIHTQHAPSLCRWRRQQLHSSWPHQQQGRHREHTGHQKWGYQIPWCASAAVGQGGWFKHVCIGHSVREERVGAIGMGPPETVVCVPVCLSCRGARWVVQACLYWAQHS